MSKIQQYISYNNNQIDIDESFIKNKNKINFDYDYDLDNDYTEEYYLNNLRDDEALDYYELIQVKIHNIPWYATQINFGLDYIILGNIEEIKEINKPYKIAEDSLILVKQSKYDYKITTNCINPEINFDEWYDFLKKKYKYLKRIKISQTFIKTNNKYSNDNIVINYNRFDDPVILSFIKNTFCVLTIFIASNFLFFLLFG